MLTLIRFCYFKLCRTNILKIYFASRIDHIFHPGFVTVKNTLPLAISRRRGGVAGMASPMAGASPQFFGMEQQQQFEPGHGSWFGFPIFAGVRRKVGAAVFAKRVFLQPFFSAPNFGDRVLGLPFRHPPPLSVRDGPGPADGGRPP